MKSSLVWFTVLFITFFSLGTAFLVQSFQTPQSESSGLAATYTNGVLHVAIPYASQHAGAGRLIIDVLDPEDRSLGRMERRAEISEQGAWNEQVKLDSTIPASADDLVWN